MSGASFPFPRHALLSISRIQRRANLCSVSLNLRTKKPTVFPLSITSDPRDEPLRKDDLRVKTSRWPIVSPSIFLSFSLPLLNPSLCPHRHDISCTRATRVTRASVGRVKSSRKWRRRRWSRKEGKAPQRSSLPFNVPRHAAIRLAIRDNAPQSVYLARLLNFGMRRTGGRANGRGCGRSADARVRAWLFPP